MSYKLFSGHPTPTKFGVPYVIVSIEENEKFFKAFRYFFFESSKAPIAICDCVNYPRHPKMGDFDIDDILRFEKSECEHYIREKIIKKEFASMIINDDFINVNLNESDQGLLYLLNLKFPSYLFMALNDLEVNNLDKELTTFIRLYRSIRKERVGGFDLVNQKSIPPQV